MARNANPIPHRKLDPDVGRPGEFSVPAQQHGKGFKVKVDPNNYDVWEKPLSDNLPETFDGATIRWFANFGLKRKGKGAGDPYEKQVDRYTVELDDEPDSKVVYFDGQNAQYPLEVKRENGKSIATLELGDPDVGFRP